MESVEVEEAILATWPRVLQTRDRVLLGVSGGADSVAMLRAIRRIRPDRNSLAVAHFNHQWRGLESDQDQAFVQRLCEHLCVDCHTGCPPSAELVRASEEDARRQRYDFLERTAYRIGARYVATAHTASDRTETLLHNLFRGTGLAGVRSIQVTRPFGSELVLVRPMLRCYREHVIAYLESLAQNYRSDSSNLDCRYRRNFLRHKLLPAVRDAYGESVDQKLIHFADNALEVDELLNGLAEAYLKKVESIQQGPPPPSEDCCSVGRSSLRIPLQKFCPVEWPVLRQAIALCFHRAGWGLGRLRRLHWEQIRELHGSGNEGCSPLNLPGGIQVRCRSGWLRFTLTEAKDAVD